MQNSLFSSLATQFVIFFINKYKVSLSDGWNNKIFKNLFYKYKFQCLLQILSNVEVKQKSPWERDYKCSQQCVKYDLSNRYVNYSKHEVSLLS